MPWTATTPRPATSAAEQALIEDPARSDALIAAETSCSTTTIGLVRAALERSGQIPVIPVQQRLARPKPAPPPSPTQQAIAAGARTPREVADAASVSLQAGWKALRHAAFPLADCAAAADALSVTIAYTSPGTVSSGSR